MIQYHKTKIRQYEIFIRDIVSSVINKIDYDKLHSENKSFLNKTKERFCFDNNRGWKFLCACLDTIGDSNFALVEFQNYRIENKRKINTGENYLRIYGVLNAVQIQQHSILKLSDLVKLDSLGNLTSSFKELDITFLRHSISAHPVNYDDRGKKVSFKIDRTSINDFGNLSLRNEHNSVKIYNIFDSLNEYVLKAENTLENITEKLIENLYKTAKSKKMELVGKLSEIKNSK